MKAWGQWIEPDEQSINKVYYSFQINMENKYRFSHWLVRDGWREAYGEDHLVKNTHCSFYLMFKF